MPRLFLLAMMAGLSLLAGCANQAAKSSFSPKTAFAETEEGRRLDADDPVPMSPAKWSGKHSRLAGRTLTVSSLGDLKLRPKEVILTFDDGPVPGRTENILETLDVYGVKATFLMVGQMADAYPAAAQEVVAHGHTIGSHTYRHADLTHLGFDGALSEIMRGENAVRKASQTAVPFFRFPYLADTARLRAALARRDMIIMDADIDSKDYFETSPAAVTTRTMAALRKRGGGIILLHDIHRRTSTMLPSLLSQLQSEGYSVVTLRYKRPGLPELLAMAND